MLDFIFLTLLGMFKVSFLAGSLVIPRTKKRKPFWVQYAHGRIRQNKNLLLFIGGPTGSGKSWTGLSFCEMVDKRFTSERIVTSMKGLMKLINSGKLKSGDAILWDESGIDISSKNWQSLTNKMINFLMQVFRHKNLIVVFTSPHLDFIDASTRKLFHAEFQTCSINEEKKTCKVKPQLISYNSRYSKFYYKYLRVKTDKKGIVPFKYWNVPKPSDELIKEYDIIKEQFTADLYKDIEAKLEVVDPTPKEDIMARKPVTEKQARVMKLMAKHNNVAQVAEFIGLSTKAIYDNLKAVRKKGYELHEFTEKALENKQIDVK